VEDNPFRVTVRDLTTRTVVRRQGKYLKVTVEKRVGQPPISKLGRKVTGYSRQSRKRFLQLIATIDWERVDHALLVTLTYPDNYVERGIVERNKNKYLFLRAMEKYLGIKLSGVWRLEWMERKTGKFIGVPMPHWHLLIFGLDWIDKDVIRDRWRRATGIEGCVCTDVREAGSPSKCAVYAAKYAAKFHADPSLDYVPNLNTVGRQWGTMRRSLIPRCPVLYVHNLNDTEIEFLMGRALELLPWRREEDSDGFTLLGDTVSEVWEDFYVRHIDRVGELS
jgi:hypothetical protein